MASHTWKSPAGVVSYLNTGIPNFGSGSAEFGWFGVDMHDHNPSNRNIDGNFCAMLFFDTSTFPSADTLKYKNNIRLRMHAVAIGYKSNSSRGYAYYINRDEQRYVSCKMCNSSNSATSLVNMNLTQLKQSRTYVEGTQRTVSVSNEYIDFYYDYFIDYARHKCTFFEFLGSIANGVYYGGLLENIQDTYLMLTYDDVIPTGKMTSPVEGAEFHKSQAVTFRWSYSESKDVGQKSFSIKYTTGGQTQTVTRSTSNHYYTFPSGTFSEGEVSYYLTVTNNDNQSSTSGPYTAVCVPSYPSVEATYPVNIGVPKSQPFTISWKFSETASTGQKNYSMSITQNGKTKTLKGTGEATSHTIPAYQYVDGTVTYSITVTNNDGQSATKGPYSFNIVPSYPTVQGVYPIDVLVKKSKEFSIAWNYSETVSVGQTKYWVYITQNGQTTEYSGTSANHFHTIAANTLSNGACSYTIKVLNKDGQYGTCGPYAFVVVGDSDAPEIIEVTNDAKPIITWEIDSQNAFEIVIYDDSEKKVYESGVIVDEHLRNHQVNTLLQNGKYIVNIRALNIYGYYTPWGTYYLTLDAECKSSIEKIYVFATHEYGVSVNCEVTGGKAYVIRKKADAGDVEIIGEYKEGFIDYTVPLKDTYQYAIRLYDCGITDSAWRVTKVKADGVVIRDFRDEKNLINLWMSEEDVFSTYMEDSREKNLIKCLGRTYPIKEQGEWKASKRSFKAYVTERELKALTDMKINGNVVKYQAEGEYMVCDMDLTDNGPYMDGRIVTANLTRVDI